MLLWVCPGFISGTLYAVFLKGADVLCAKKFVSKPSVAKFCEYLKTRKKQLLVKMALFAKIICMKFLQEDL